MQRPMIALALLALAALPLVADTPAYAQHTLRVITGCDNIPEIPGLERGVDIGAIRPVQQLVYRLPTDRIYQRWRRDIAQAQRLMERQGRCFVFHRGMEKDIGVNAAWTKTADANDMAMLVRQDDGSFTCDPRDDRQRLNWHRRVAEIAAVGFRTRLDMPPDIEFGHYTVWPGFASQRRLLRPHQYSPAQLLWARKWDAWADANIRQLRQAGGGYDGHHIVLPDPHDPGEWTPATAKVLDRLADAGFPTVVFTVRCIDYQTQTLRPADELLAVLQALAEFNATAEHHVIAYLDNASTSHYRYADRDRNRDPTPQWSDRHTDAVRRFAQPPD